MTRRSLITGARPKGLSIAATLLLFSGAAYAGQFRNDYGKCRTATRWEDCVYSHDVGNRLP